MNKWTTRRCSALFAAISLCACLFFNLGRSFGQHGGEVSFSELESWDTSFFEARTYMPKDGLESVLYTVNVAMSSSSVPLGPKWKSYKDIQDNLLNIKAHHEFFSKAFSAIGPTNKSEKQVILDLVSKLSRTNGVPGDFSAPKNLIPGTGHVYKVYQNWVCKGEEFSEKCKTLSYDKLKYTKEYSYQLMLADLASVIAKSSSTNEEIISVASRIANNTEKMKFSAESFVDEIVGFLGVVSNMVSTLAVIFLLVAFTGKVLLCIRMSPSCDKVVHIIAQTIVGVATFANLCTILSAFGLIWWIQNVVVPFEPVLASTFAVGAGKGLIVQLGAALGFLL